MVQPFGAHIFRYARNGDTNIIRAMFDLGTAKPSDTTPDGASLLSVRELPMGVAESHY
jgi:hypothetical protein